MRYEYNGMGNRTGRLEYRMEGFAGGGTLPENPTLPKDPAKETEYLLDLTRPYFNLLGRREISEGQTVSQVYTWDSNVVYATEGESAYLYLQDELGSPVRLVKVQENNSQEMRQTVYGYDEFGNDRYGTQGEVQPFGYTGYQKDTVADTYFAQAREYLPKVGRFGGEDWIKNGINWYVYCRNNPIRFVDPFGLAEYVIGEPTEPEYIFDEDFIYDPNAKATAKDYVDYVLWGEASNLAYIVMPDGARAYKHYRSGTGDDLKVDIEKAFKEDSYYNARFNQMISEAQAAAEELHKKNKQNSFSMTGDLFSFSNGTSENWQKALGGFHAWGSADIVYNNGEYTMTYTVHVKDRYNFNKGQADIASGTPDDVNGRFAVLGWAKSFISYGEATRIVTWEQNSMETTNISCETGR